MNKKPIVMQTEDRFTFNRSQRVTTDAGYLIVPASIARTGVQQYTSKEMGLEGPNRIVNVLRDAADVFSEDSLKSFKTAPLTNGHPGVPVTSQNSKEFSVGFMDGEVSKADDGIRMNANLIFTDAETITEIDAGKDQISVGYRNELVPIDITVDGFHCEYKQTAIRANHIALVERGRAGASCSLSDDAVELQKLLNDEETMKEDKGKEKDPEKDDKSKETDKGSDKSKEKEKEVGQTTDAKTCGDGDDKKPEDADKSKEKEKEEDKDDQTKDAEPSEAEKLAASFTSTIDAYQDEIRGLKSENVKLQETVDSLETKMSGLTDIGLTADSDSLTKFIEDRVNEKVIVIQKVGKLGMEIDVADKSIADIKTEVVKSRHPDLDASKLTNDAYIDARFDVICETNDSGVSNTLQKVLADSAVDKTAGMTEDKEVEVDLVAEARQRKIDRNHK